MTNKNAESTQPAAAPVDTWFGDVLAGLGEVIPFASTHAAPDLDPSLYGWLQERGIAPDSHEGQIDMSEVVEALNEHERQLLGSTSAAPGIDLAPRPMATAPRDGTMLRLLVQFDDHATEDTEGPAWTIGACNDDNVHQDERAGWQFAGWCWDHDHFTEGKGTPVGWLPLIDASPKGGNTDENNDLLPELRDVEDYFTSVDPNPIHLATVRQAISAIVGSPKGGSDVPGIPEPHQECYSDDGGDSWHDHPADAELVEGLSVGETYTLTVSHYSVERTYRVTKAPDETSDDYEVEPVQATSAEVGA